LVSAGAFACSGGGNDSGGSTQPAGSAPAIILSSATATFAASAGAASPAAQSVTISNGGTGTLSGLATGSIVYGSGQTGGWLAASLSGATAPATLTLTPTTGTLAAGTYTANVPVTATVSGVTNSPQSVNLTLTIGPATAAATTNLSTGQSSAFLTTPNFNTTLAVQPGSQYLVAVVNTDPSNTQVEGFSLTGSFVTSAASQRAPVLTALPPARASASPQPTYSYNGPSLPSSDMLRGAAQNHNAVLEQNRQIYANFGNPKAAWAAARSSGGRQATVSAAITQTIGAVSKVYVLHAIGGTCTSVDSIGARTVAVGQHVIVLADTSLAKWPQAFRPDSSFYQTFANEYDQITWPHLLANIGNPLAYDASLSGTGKVTVTITPVLNNFGGNGGTIVAFVNSCDFYPLVSNGANADFSNKTEMFYSFVPSASGYSVATWEAELRATAAHETKHIVSFTDRIMNNSPAFEQIWLEEGIAQESSEIWERNFNQAIWKGNANFFQTVGCELNLGPNAPCDAAGNKPYALVGSHLPFLFQYLQAESSSNSEGLGQDTPANYGAGWTIARWATDQYAASGGEGPFIQSLINEPSLIGLNNLAAHTGQSVPLVLVYWNLATAIFQTPAYTAADVRITIPSFNFAQIDSIGQTALTCNSVHCGLFTANQSPTPTYPIAPIAVAATATFSKTVNSVPGTSASYFLLSGSAAGVETLQLLTPAGAALSAASGFRVAIVRVQ
jgi:hypothetical protein